MSTVSLDILVYICLVIGFIHESELCKAEDDNSKVH